MKLISRHNGRRFAEQNGPEGKERKSHTLLILQHILRFPLTGKLLANKENEGKYHIIDQLTGSKVFQQQEALVSCSLFQNQAGLCCSISTETKKKKSFPQAKAVFIIVCVREKAHCCDKLSAWISPTKQIQVHKIEGSFTFIEVKKEAENYSHNQSKKSDNFQKSIS